MNRKLSLLIIGFAILSSLHVYSQLKYGLYGGINFSGITTQIPNVRNLPVDQGGANLMLGGYCSYELARSFELEAGLNYFGKGYTYEQIGEYDIPYDFYNTMKTVSLPVTLMYYYIGKDDYGEFIENLRLGVGGGFYTAYTLSGKITDEDGNITVAGFSNTNRLDLGARIMFKVVMNKFEVFFVKEFGLTNTIKDGSANLKQNALNMGVGIHF